MQLNRNGKQSLSFLQKGDNIFLFLPLFGIASRRFYVYIVQTSNLIPKMPSNSRLKYNRHEALLFL